MRTSVPIVELRTARTSNSLVLLAMILLLAAPLCSLFGEISYMSAMNLIDDPNTEYRDMVELSEITIGTYQRALAQLEQAIFLQADNGVYLKTKADMHSLLLQWSSALRALNAPVPPELPTYNDAERALTVALRNDPIDPALHLMMAGLYRETGDRKKAVQELERATVLFPLDPEVRYEVASSFLQMGMNDLALEHATALANIDDSYNIRDAALKVHLKENDPIAYKSYLMKSYLAKAYEIIWRASGQNIHLLEEIELDGPEAVDTKMIFYELKGLD